MTPDRSMTPGAIRMRLLRISERLHAEVFEDIGEASLARIELEQGIF